MPLGTSDLALVRALVRREAGILLEEQDAPRVEERLQPLARTEGCASVAQLVQRLRTPAARHLVIAVVDALLAQAPPFLWDHRVAQDLAERVLPDLIARREAVRRLRFWCPLCGGAQAPASLALLISERFPQLASWEVQILATDRTPASIAELGTGRFSPVEVAQGLPTQVLLKRFRRTAPGWQLEDAARARIRYAVCDVREELPAQEAPMDLIVLRRVLVYLDAAERGAFVERLRARLAPDGYLFLHSRDAASIAAGLQDPSPGGTGFYRPR